MWRRKSARTSFRRSGYAFYSHDRYAKFEVDYLLQRLETPRGLAIPTTGGRGGLDEAFLEEFDVVIRVQTSRNSVGGPFAKLQPRRQEVLSLMLSSLCEARQQLRCATTIRVLHIPIVHRSVGGETGEARHGTAGSLEQLSLSSGD